MEVPVYAGLLVHRTDGVLEVSNAVLVDRRQRAWAPVPAAGEALLDPLTYLYVLLRGHKRSVCGISNTLPDGVFVEEEGVADLSGQRTGRYDALKVDATAIAVDGQCGLQEQPQTTDGGSCLHFGRRNVLHVPIMHL